MRTSGGGGKIPGVSKADDKRVAIVVHCNAVTILEKSVATQKGGIERA